MNQRVLIHVITVLYMIYLFQISNGLGAIAGLAQLILYACYCSRKPEDDDDDHAAKKPTDIQLSARNGAVTV